MIIKNFHRKKVKKKKIINGHSGGMSDWPQ